MARTLRPILLTSLLAGAMGVCVLGAAGANASSPLVKGSSGPLSATLLPSTHTPKVNVKWPITVTATLSGKPAHATAFYEFLFGGSVVSTQYVSNNKHFSFTGHFSDKLLFPADSAGEPLTLRVVIKAAGHTVNLNWSITSHT
ncbi:MAG: hypothetical protein ABR947_12230 [Solirubrobacteraceae bacterium]|jgi:hypothetical protein